MKANGMSKALAKVKDQKFTVQEKKLIVDSIKLRYNGMLQALRRATNAAIHKKEPVDYDGYFPFRMDPVLPAFLSTLSTKERAQAKKIESDIETLRKSWETGQELLQRAQRDLRERGRAMETSLEAERDQLIFQISLMGSSQAAQDIINNLRSAEELQAELAKTGIEVMAEACNITGIGKKMPKQLIHSKERDCCSVSEED